MRVHCTTRILGTWSTVHSVRRSLCLWFILKGVLFLEKRVALGSPIGGTSSDGKGSDDVDVADWYIRSSDVIPTDADVGTAVLPTVELGEAPEAPIGMVVPSVVHRRRRVTSFDAASRVEVAAAFLRSQALIFDAGCVLMRLFTLLNVLRTGYQFACQCTVANPKLYLLSCDTRM